ncbi:medium-chain acyl-CoA ligase ACSF2, mitochondrial-like isoform X1 [Periplaneta americana]|uniref:medium-chain acyl-CoA ligase ACSF2, mitochondrial-like isoform X1 n=1 Tax=Periplaneta americana TaxID=6978 RepID=UPI0037E9C605
MRSVSDRRYKPSYWHTPGKTPLSPLTIGQLIDQAAEKWGEKEAFVSLYQDQRFTFREIKEKADCLAAGLLKLGLSPGDRLAIWGPNSSEWYIARFAAARGGFIAVHLDPAYQPPQLLYTLNEVEVKAIISSEFYKNNSCYEILRTVIPELDSCPESGVKLQGAKFPTLETVILMSDKQYRGAYRLDDIMASADSEHLEKIYEIQSVIQPDDGCAIHFSSGTTGVPKGVLLSHHNIVNVVIILDERIDIDRTKEDKSVVATQFCHLSVSLTAIIMGLHNGATCIIPTPVFDYKENTGSDHTGKM